MALLFNLDATHRILILLAGLCFLAVTVTADALTLEDAERAALASEPGTLNLQGQSMALRELAISDGQLPDPMLQLGAINVPVDSFELDQAPMTQMRIGVKQEFPGGRTREIRTERTLLQSEAMSYKAADRRLKVLRELRTSWFEALFWDAALALLEEDRIFFSQLLDVTEALYSVGRMAQQDVIRADLELSNLNNRIIKAREQLDIQKHAIARWIDPTVPATELSLEWASLAQRELLSDETEALAPILLNHPLLLSIDSEVKTAEREVDLAEESRKPNWALEAGYGFRDGVNTDGTSRSDFLTVAASIQLPLFKKNRQDKVTTARSYQYEAAKDRYLDAARQLIRDARSENTRREQLSERLALYQSSILPQAELQSEATRTAYQADTTDFAELMRAYLSEQASQLEYERLRTDEQQALAQLHYLLPTSEELAEDREHEQDN
jgi:outer membrane protein TolC